MTVTVTLTDPSIPTTDFLFTDRDAAEVAAYVVMMGARTGQTVPLPGPVDGAAGAYGTLAYVSP